MPSAPELSGIFRTNAAGAAAGGTRRRARGSAGGRGRRRPDSSSALPADHDDFRRGKLRTFVEWSTQYVTGDEKGQAQIFLDRLFQGKRPANLIYEELGADGTMGG
jgi:hypothetical protein